VTKNVDGKVTVVNVKRYPAHVSAPDGVKSED
jgi:hypothetical protein